MVEQVKEATKGGVDFAFEMAGAVRAMETAFKITKRGGTTITAGLPPPTRRCRCRWCRWSPRSGR